MKTPLKSMYLTIAFLGAVLGSHAKAQYLLTINDSDPSAVTITGTGADATATDSAARYSGGVFLANFYSAVIFANSNANATGSTLVTGVDGTPAYTGTQSNSIGSTPGLQFYAASGNFEDFVAGMPAFNGTVTFNLSAIAADLPADGTTGNVLTDPYTLFGPPAATVIGTYKVSNAATPEPSSMALMLVGGVALLAWRFRSFVPSSRGLTVS
jgi:hypothetical protein